jgi:hypothetical protein
VPDPVADLQKRVANLESNLKKRDWIDILGALSPFLTALLVAWLGFSLKDSVDQALAREELHLTSVSEMQGLLATLRKADVTKEDASAAALTLAAFGHYAIPLLMVTLAEADDVRAPAAEEGLEAIGASEPEAVCKRLHAEVTERSGRHHYTTHIAALRLIGNIPCPAALSAVTAYRAEVEALKTPDAIATFSARYRQPLAADSVEELRDQLAQTATLLTGRR